MARVVSNGYKPDAPVIGLLINQIEGRYQSLIRRGLADLARETGVHLKIFVGRSLGSPYGNEDLFNRIYSLAGGSSHEELPDGLVVTAGSIGSFLEQEQNLAFLDSFKPMPLVTIGMTLPGYPSVETDNAGGMTALTEHLVQSHDFARFAFLTGPDHSPDAAARLVSWNETLERHGIPEERRIVYPGDLSYGSGQALAAHFASESRLPFDVLSCANDDMALGFIQNMGRQGFSCPRDYAVTGFDDIQEAGFLSPLLTTVHQPLYEQAYTAGLRLLQELGLSGLPAAPDDSLACLPVIRESCGCTDIPLITATDRPEKTRLPLPAEVKDKTAEAVTSLTSAAVLDLRKFVDRPLFLQVLSGLLDFTGNWDDFSNRWHVILSAVRRDLATDGGDIRTLRYLEDLFASAFALLTRKSTEQHARELSLLRDTLHFFRELSLELAPVTDEETLVRLLKKNVPLAGCTRVILALHRPNPKNPETDEEDGFYDDVELVPCLDTPGGTDSVRMPLLGITQSYGYIILEGTGLDALVFESLRDQVSQTLESIARTKDRERVEQALRDSEERYREMAAAVPVMVLETDTLLRIEYRNAAAASGLVIPDDAALKSLKTYLEPEDASLAEDAVQRVRETRELNSPGIRLVSPDRRRYIPVVKISGKFDQKGNLVRIRWDALDPLPFLNSGILPDKEFFTAHKITGREQEIVELQLQGYRIRDIAEKLFIAESTVKGHLTQVYNKLGITGKGELLRMLRDEQVGRFGFSAYVFSLVNSLLSPDEN
ncbi:MAG: substrate-binding domain-containing protein [Treponema sp.]|nr:substrate-binding domain-containing protein [Treponema sp.]